MIFFLGFVLPKINDNKSNIKLQIYCLFSCKPFELGTEQMFLYRIAPDAQILPFSVIHKSIKMDDSFFRIFNPFSRKKG